MATQPSFLRISETSQSALHQYLEQTKSLAYRNWNIREMMRAVDIQYMREADWTEEQQKAKVANRSGNTSKFQNITVPVVLPQVEAAVTYQSSVFLSGTPIFGCVAEPELIDPARQLETILQHQATKGGWTRHLMMAFRDAFKYNWSAVEVEWKRIMIPQITTSISGGGSNSEKVTQVAWEGNCLTRLDPYNVFWDTRYAVADVATRGEFAGYQDLISRIELKKFIANNSKSIIASNIKRCLEAATPAINIGTDTAQFSYYVPQISQIATQNITNAYAFNWMAWALLESQEKTIDYKNIYQKTVLYCRILPSDFGISVPAANTAQIWKLVYVNDILLQAEPQSFAYDSLPMLFMSPLEDGLKLQTKSLAQNGEAFQSVTSALMNSVIASRRRAISDRVLYDPSRVTEANINSDNPSAKIPVRPAAYGKPVGESVYQFPYRDDQSQIALAEVGNLVELSNQLVGQNRAKQGQFVKGNKTQKEYSSVMANANGRDQMISLLLEDQFFTPLKEILKLNILQYQTPATLYSKTLKTAVKIDPVALRKAAIEFKISDGLVPSEKLINGEAFQTALQVIGSSPQISASYNIGPMFSYLMKTQGAEIDEFEKSQEQQMYEQAMSQWNQTIQMIVEKAVKANADLSKLSYPPQPVPSAYGYDPKAPKKEEPGESQSILAQYQGTENGEAAS